MRCMQTAYRFILVFVIFLPTIGISEQKQMTLAKYCNSLQTELGPIYTSSHRNCLLIQLQKFCCVCLTLFISSLVFSAKLQSCFFFFSFTFSYNQIPSRLNYSSLQPFSWLFNSLCQPCQPLFNLTALFLLQFPFLTCQFGI